MSFDPGAARSRRAVVKLGSSVVTLSGPTGLQVDRNTIYRLAADAADAARRGTGVIVVSSGAVSMGVEELGLGTRPTELADMQACAAVGQGLLMQLWRDAFARYGKRVGQVLLTHADLAHRRRMLNVRATLESLLARDVVPIINENDTVMTDEITVGDNDQLAAQVAKLTGADRLLLLSTVDGLLDASGAVVPLVRPGDSAESLVGAERSSQGRGGMGSKLQSARAAAHGGIEVVITNGRREQVVTKVLAGEAIGTRVEAADRGLTARKHWIAYTLRPAGRLVLDAGAMRAVLETGASLLPVGLSRVEGDFEEGDPVAIVGPDGQELARGLARVGADDLRSGDAQGPAVHRDDLVVLPEEDRR